VPFSGDKSRFGWAALCSEPWHLAAVYGTRKQADAKSRELGEAYKVVYGEQRIGSDEFIVHEGPPRRRGRSSAPRSPSR
jgi:hypothetical protein